MAVASQNYDHWKDHARDPDPGVRAAVAARADTPAELLYFLASDAAPEVRRAVAENPSTPRQADTLLAQDDDYAVRCLLARKIVGTGLEGDTRSQLWRLGFTILETLARDTAVRVRQALSDAIKGVDGAPREIVLRLANDPERAVAEPVVIHSPALEDGDIAALVDRDGKPEWFREAAACRGKIGPKLAKAIVGTGSVRPIAALLRNMKAEIDDETIERVVDQAEKVEVWHEPLVERPSLPRTAIAKLAGFVGASLLAKLRARPDVDAKTAETIDKIAESRGEAFAAAAFRGAAKSRHAARPRARVPDAAKVGAAELGRSAVEITRKATGWDAEIERVKRLRSERRLTLEILRDALKTGDSQFVMAALSFASGLGRQAVERIIGSHSGEAVTALCWKARVPMRFAVEVQQRLAQVPLTRMVHASNGEHYPIEDEEMVRQLEMFENG